MQIGLVFFCSITNNQPDAQGKRRLDLAVELLESKYIDQILITGGKRKTARLGEIYRDYLVNLGIPAELIWFEGESNTTVSNLKAANDILLTEDMPNKTITGIWFISDYCGLWRVHRLIKRRGYWPWPIHFQFTAIAWRYIFWEPLKWALNEIDPDEKSLGWFKYLRNLTNR